MVISKLSDSTTWIWRNGLRFISLMMSAFPLLSIRYRLERVPSNKLTPVQTQKSAVLADYFYYCVLILQKGFLLWCFSAYLSYNFIRITHITLPYISFSLPLHPIPFPCLHSTFSTLRKIKLDFTNKGKCDVCLYTCGLFLITYFSTNMALIFFTTK